MRTAPAFSSLPFVLVLGFLGACRQETMQAGDLRVTQLTFLSTNTLHAACTQFNTDGTPLSSTTIDNSGTGDVAMLHEAGSIFAGALAAVVKAAKPPGTLRDEGDRRDMAAENGQKAAAACVLEHFKGETAPFPPPLPPQQGGQQQSTHDPGTRPYALADNPFTPAVSMAPFLDADGLAHAADDIGGGA